MPEEIEAFLGDKEAVLVVEEGQPAFIEQEIRSLAQQAGIICKVWGKGVLPTAGEYTADVVRTGLAAWLDKVDFGTQQKSNQKTAGPTRIELPVQVPPRPPGFCTGCPERPLFSALELVQRERGPLHISMDIGCNTFATLPPFNIGSTVLGYGLSMASGGAIGPALDQPTVVVMGDGGFWHNGLITGISNAYWHGYDAVLIILENGYASATGQQHVPSTGSTPWGRPSRISIESTLRGMGVEWIRRVDAYDVTETLAVLREALSARGPHLRVIISDQECMLARQRRDRRLQAERRKAGQPLESARFGVDAEVCTGDHACMRLSGCPSLTLRPTSDPLKDGPTAYVDSSCLACGLCGANAHTARLCPSFYEVKRIQNPGSWQRLRAGVRDLFMKLLGAS